MIRPESLTDCADAMEAGAQNKTLRYAAVGVIVVGENEYSTHVLQKAGTGDIDASPNHVPGQPGTTLRSASVVH